MTQQTIQIDRSKLIEELKKLKGAKLISISYISDARVKKTGNPHKLVNKRCTINCVLNYSYSKALAKRLANLGKDPSAAKNIHDRTWGVRVEHTPLIKHTGKDGIERTYLDCMILKTVGKTIYTDTVTNKELNYEDIKDFLPNRDPSTVKVANISLENVKSVKMKGIEYAIS